MKAGRNFGIAPGKGLEKFELLDDALGLRQGNGFIWLDFFNPTPRRVDPLVAPLGLHPLAIEDCVDDDQVPKMDEYPATPSYYFNRYRHAGDAAVIEEV